MCISGNSENLLHDDAAFVAGYEDRGVCICNHWSALCSLNLCSYPLTFYPRSHLLSFSSFFPYPSFSPPSPSFFAIILSSCFCLILFVFLPLPSLLNCNLLLSPDYLLPFSSFFLSLSLSIIYLSLAGFILLYTSLSPPPSWSLSLSALVFFPFFSYLHPSPPLIMSPPYFSSLTPSQMTI